MGRQMNWARASMRDRMRTHGVDNIGVELIPGLPPPWKRGSGLYELSCPHCGHRGVPRYKPAPGDTLRCGVCRQAHPYGSKVNRPRTERRGD